MYGKNGNKSDFSKCLVLNIGEKMKPEKFTKRERLLLGMVIICLLLNIITLFS